MAERSAILAGAWDFNHENIEEFSSSSDDEQDTLEKATIIAKQVLKSQPKNNIQVKIR